MPNRATFVSVNQATVGNNHGTTAAYPNRAVREIGRVLMDLRRMIHLAVIAGAVAAVHNFGPVQWQAPVDQYVVRPLLRTSAFVQRELASGAALVSGLGTRLNAGGQQSE